MTAQIDPSFSEGAFCLSGKNASPWQHNDHLLLTLEGNTGIKQYILDQTAGAKHYLKICSFLLTDREVFEALMKRARQYDLAIFLLTSLDEKKIVSSSFDEEFEERDLDEHLQLISRLFQEGVHVRAASYIHAKFLIADGQEGLLTSANLTTNSMNQNPESGVLLHGQELKDLESIFDTVYVHGTEFRQFLMRKGKMDISLTVPDIPLKKIPDINSGTLFTITTHSRAIYDHMLEIINAAQEELYISSYNFAVLERLPDLIEALEDALHREVKVKLFCRGMNYRQDHREACTTFTNLGCEIRADVFNHSKGISNGENAMIFTANIDGRHGLDGSGFEVGYVLSESQTRVFDEFLHWQFDNAPLAWKASPDRNLLFRTYQWIQAQKSNEIPHGSFDELILVLEGFDGDLIRKITTSLVYGRYCEDELVAVSCKGHHYKARITTEDEILIENEMPEEFCQTSYLLQYESLNFKSYTT